MSQLTRDQLRGVLEKGTVSYTIANALTKVVAITNTLLVLRSLTPYAYGVAELALSVVGVFSIFQLSGLERTVIADMGVEKGSGNIAQSRRIFQDFMMLLLGLCGIAWSVLFFGSEIVAQFFTPEIGSYFTIISFLFLATPFTASMRILYGTYFDFTASALFTFLQEATKLIFLAAFFFLGTVSISIVLWSYVVAQLAPFVLLLPRTYRHVRNLTAVEMNLPAAPWRFFQQHNLWTLFSNYLDTFTKSFRLWLIKLFLGTEAVALFAVAQGIVGQLSSFINLHTVVSPVLPQYLHNRQIFYRIIDATLKYQILLALGVIGSGIVLVPILVEFLFPQYLAALPLFYLMVFVLIPSSINGVFQTMFYVLKAQRSLFNAQLARLVFTGGFGSVAMMSIGIPGVALEYVASAAFFAYERRRALRALYSDFTFRPRDFFVFDEYDRVLLRRIYGKLRMLVRPSRRG